MSSEEELDYDAIDEEELHEAMMAELLGAEGSKRREQKKEAERIVKAVLKLVPQQEVNVANILNIIGHKDSVGISPVARDASETGHGKTYCFVAIALALGIPLFNVCPAAVMPSTRRKIKSIEGARFYKSGEKGMRKVGNISYSSLIINNDWLIPPASKGDPYVIRPAFKEAVKEGILFVCDEFHKTKNDFTSTSKAVATLTRYIVDEYNAWDEKMEMYEKELRKWQRTVQQLGEEESIPEEPEKPEPFRTRIYVASATQMDKAEQAQTFLYVMGIIEDYITTSSGMEFRNFLTTARDIEASFDKSCKGRVPNRLDAIQKHYAKYHYELVLYRKDGTIPSVDTLKKMMAGLTNEALDQIIYSITTSIIFNRISSEIEPFLPRVNFNGFFSFDTPKSKKEYQKALYELIDAYLTGAGGCILSTITRSILGMQMAACGSACAYLYRMYTYDTTSKICLSAKYVDVLRKAKKIFMQLGIPESEIAFFVGEGNKMDGKSTGKREDNLRAFQAKNLDKRVLLMTTSIGAGFDADDKNPDGNRRYMIILKDYSAIDQHQMAGRIFRLGMYTYGIAMIWNPVAFGAAFNAITEAIKRKSAVLGDVTLSQEEIHQKRFFPGNYPRYIDSAFLNETDVEGLYINEEQLAEENNGERLSDYELLLRVSKGKPLPVYDPPKAYITVEDDDCPAKRQVSTEGKGNKGIYRNNPRVVDKYIIDDDMSRTKEIQKVFADVEAAIARSEKEKKAKLKKAKKGGAVELYKEETE